MDHASGVPTLSRWGLSNQVDIMRNDDCKPKSATEFGVDLMEVDGVDRAPQCWRRDMDLASGVSTLRRWGMSNQVDNMRNDNYKYKYCDRALRSLNGGCGNRWSASPGVGAEALILGV